MHDPMTVIADLPRPWPKVRTGVRPRVEQPPGFRHRQIGPVNIRAARFRCAHCDGGKIKDPVPSYHHECSAAAFSDREPPVAAPSAPREPR